MPAPDHSENHSVFYNKEIEGKGEDTFFQLLRKRKFESLFSENRSSRQSIVPTFLGAISTSFFFLSTIERYNNIRSLFIDPILFMR